MRVQRRDSLVERRREHRLRHVQLTPHAQALAA